MKQPSFKNMLWAWKAVDVDFTTRDGFQWPFPKNWVSSCNHLVRSNTDPCPIHTGDGLCLAKNFAGAALRGKPTHTVLICGYKKKDVLGQDDDKLRVKKCYVYALWDAHKLIIKYGRNSDLRGSDLSGSNLSDSDLSGSNLRGSDLSGSNLSGSNLSGSNLSGSNLRGSDLSGSNLSGSNLENVYLSEEQMDSVINLDKAIRK